MNMHIGDKPAHRSTSRGAARGSLSATAVAAAMACGHALAQTPQPPAGAATASPAAAAGGTESITVTGSRILRKDFVTDSPITTVGAEALQRSGPATIESTLNQLPQFNSSSTGTTQAGANQQARGARANLNLRGLGTARTLVLLDGKRPQPSDPFGHAVDTNTIPAAIIQNVEIISGGASAVYGSDAVAGVVNIITKRNFEGLRFDVQYGETSRSDGQSVDMGLLLGNKFADGRGSSLISLSFLERKAAYRDSRAFFDNTGDTNAPPQGRYTPSANNLPSAAALQTLFAGYGSASPTPTQALSINRDNTLFSTAPGRNLRLTAADGYVMQPGNTGFVIALTPHEAGTLLNPTRRYNGYGAWDYKLGAGVQAYASVNLTSYSAHNQQRGSLNGTSPVATVPASNPFLPADLRAVLASRANPGASFNYSFFGDRVGPQVFTYDYEVGQVTAGAKGDVGYRNWKWDAYVRTGRTTYDLTQSGMVNISALQTLLNAADGGASTCSGGFKPFAFEPLSDACRAYLERTLHEKTTMGQTVAEATVQGKLAELPAGSLNFAAGVGHRTVDFTFTGDDQQIKSLIYFARPVANSSGRSTVSELFVEASVPLLSELPGVEQLDLSLAYRTSYYKDIGSTNAYKAGLEWDVAGPLRLRGGFQRAVRAASVGELFGGGRSISSTIGTTAAGQGDPCDVTSRYRTGANAADVAALCAAQGVPAGYRFTGSTVSTSQQGNPALQPETADTYTAGFVLRSLSKHPLLSGASLSLDAYNISVKGAIGYLTTSVNLQSCYNGDGANPTYSSSNYYCSLLRRDANGNLSFPTEPAFNLSGYRTRGMDLNLDWKVDLARLGARGLVGRAGINAVFTHVSTYEVRGLATGPYVNYAGTFGNTQIDTFTSSHPKRKAVATFSYGVGPVDLALSWQYTGAMGSATNVLTPAANVAGVAAVHYYGLAGRWQVSKNLELNAGIQNIADRAPPSGPVIGQTDVVAYDVLQRRFSLGASYTF